MVRYRWGCFVLIVVFVGTALITLLAWLTVHHPTNTKPVLSVRPNVQLTWHYVAPHSVREVTDPTNVLVLVNPWNRLPASYVPPDLVRLSIPYLNPGDPENHLMRKVAVPALMALIEAAKREGIYLAGVSAFRSYATQDWLYHYYIRTQGLKVAEQYSAKPGTSEHQTGLAIDLSGSTGQYAAEPQFAQTPEGKWLAKHVTQFGFIIRYPQGMQKITEYAYEAWHIRYVGKKVATFMIRHHFTLEQYVQYEQFLKVHHITP